MALVIVADQCISCGTCKSSCTHGAIARGDSSYMIDPNLCTECKDCQTDCPTDCIRLPTDLSGVS